MRCGERTVQKDPIRDCVFMIFRKDWYDWNPKAEIFCNLGSIKHQKCIKDICPIWRTSEYVKEVTFHGVKLKR